MMHSRIANYRRGLCDALGSVAMVLLCISSPTVVAQELALNNANAAAVKVWVAKLDDDIYDTREEAVAKLIAAGEESIAPVEKTLPDANLEVVVRGLNVLSTLAVKGEAVATRDAAFDAMARLGKSSSPLVAGHAESFLSVIRSARQRDAVAWLQSRGAQFSFEGESIEFNANWQGTENDLNRLAYLYEIRSVILIGDQVNDKWLYYAKQLPELRELTLKKAKVTSAGLKQLEEVKSLSALHMLYIPLDADAIRLLTEMKQLTYVKLYGTGVKLEEAKKLAAIMPNTRLDVRPGGGFLGIGVQPHGIGVLITNVQPRSAAQQAGLDIGDVMLTFGGEKIANFEQLQAAIGKFAPGEEVEVVLQRLEKPEKIKIVLGEWESALLR